MASQSSTPRARGLADGSTASYHRSLDLHMGRFPTTRHCEEMRRVGMATKDLGVWTANDCALVLIDYQNEMFEVIRSETSADLVELNVRLLAKTAKAFEMPIVLSTVGVGYGFNGPTLPSILSELDGREAIDRSSMNAFEDKAFREAVEATGRKRLI